MCADLRLAKRTLLQRAATYLGTSALIRLFWLFEGTMDIRTWGLENLRLLKRNGERPLLVLWHGKGFVPITYFHGERLCLYASHSRAPDYGGTARAFRWLTLRLIERLGYEVLDAAEFASESRGVLRFVQTLREESGGAIAADGPEGPIYEPKPGACFLAKKAGVTLLPVGAAISSGARLDQWDFFEVPHLFSRATLVVGDPIRVPPKAGDEELERKTLELANALNHATRRAEEKLRALRSTPPSHSQGAPSLPHSRPAPDAGGAPATAAVKPAQALWRRTIEFLFWSLIEDWGRYSRLDRVRVFGLGLIALMVLALFALWWIGCGAPLPPGLVIG